MENDDIFAVLAMMVGAYLLWTLWRTKQTGPYVTLYDAQHNIDQVSGSPIVIDPGTDGSSFQFAQVPLFTIDNLPTSPVGN